MSSHRGITYHVKLMLLRSRESFGHFTQIKPNKQKTIKKNTTLIQSLANIKNWKISCNLDFRLLSHPKLRCQTGPRAQGVPSHCNLPAPSARDELGAGSPCLWRKQEPSPDPLPAAAGEHGCAQHRQPKGHLGREDSTSALSNATKVLQATTATGARELQATHVTCCARLSDSPGHSLATALGPASPAALACDVQKGRGWAVPGCLGPDITQHTHNQGDK